MSFDTIRINELAKELGLTSKEVIEKFSQLSITGKTHLIIFLSNLPEQRLLRLLTTCFS